MAANHNLTAIRCQSCGSTKIVCEGPEEITYEDRTSVNYRCTVCGHSGRVSFNCTLPSGIAIGLK